MKWPNVAIHTHVLPTGMVLFWGRRMPDNVDLDVHNSQPLLWDPRGTEIPQPLPAPTDLNGNSYNPFCSGHAFLADGRLLVAGGHLQDSKGVAQASIFDSHGNQWLPINAMNGGRWYPTVVTLSDGLVAVNSGSNFDGNVNEVPQVLDADKKQWHDRGNFGGLPLYPRMFLNIDGQVFMTGWIHNLDTNPDKFEGGFLFNPVSGDWTRLDTPHRLPLRDYFPAVMYEPGKVAVFGGGDPPVTTVETINLTASDPKWITVRPMKFPRRQHNATILPDGTVLITGGTQGPGFNNLDNSMPVHAAELWNPKRVGNADEWTTLAEESVDRCYHSSAVLLPDATVLSAGGGEYRPDKIDGHPNTSLEPNPPKDTHKDAQIFKPPYLFKSTLPRPEIDANATPDSVSRGQVFEVKLKTDTNQVGQVTWVRLSSVTHSFNQNQRINFLEFSNSSGHLNVTAPATAAECPLGHYMLFVLNSEGVPSVAKIVQLK